MRNIFRESVHIGAQIVQLAPGEKFAGMVLDDDEETSHYLVLLPDKSEKMAWKDACKWAELAGDGLPTVREQLLLCANLHEKFFEDWYWSFESSLPDDNKARAFFCFDRCARNGRLRVDTKLYAHAIRRVPVKDTP